MATEGERLARLEQRADSSENDRREIWSGMRDIQEIKIQLARIIEKLDVDASNFGKIDLDIKDVRIVLASVRELIPDDLEARLETLEKGQAGMKEAQTITSMRMALIWTGTVAIAGVIGAAVKDWFSHVLK